MPKSPILEQIESDDGVAGARARRPERVAEGARERKEAARVPQRRPRIVNQKGVPQWNSHLDDQEKSDGAGGWRTGPTPAKIDEAPESSQESE